MIECVMSSLDVASVNWWPGVDKVGKLTFCGLDLLYMDEASSSPELSLKTFVVQDDDDYESGDKCQDNGEVEQVSEGHLLAGDERRTGH